MFLLSPSLLEDLLDTMRYITLQTALTYYMTDWKAKGEEWDSRRCYPNNRFSWLFLPSYQSLCWHRNNDVILIALWSLCRQLERFKPTEWPCMAEFTSVGENTVSMVFENRCQCCYYTASALFALDCLFCRVSPLLLSIEFLTIMECTLFGVGIAENLDTSTTK